MAATRDQPKTRLHRQTGARVAQPADLIQRLGAGDRAAVEYVYRRYWSSLVTFCVRRAGPAIAEDIAQETMLRAVGHASRMEEGRPFRGLLWIIAFHLCIDEARKRRNAVSIEELRRKELDIDEDGRPDHLDAELARAPEEDPTFDAALGRLCLQRAFCVLAEMNPRQSRVLLHYSLANLPYRAICAEESMSVEAVKSIIFRARCVLRSERAQRESLDSQSLRRTTSVNDDNLDCLPTEPESPPLAADSHA